MPLNLIELNQVKIDALSRTQTIFFIPVGCIEDHGPHLPVGLDLIEADALCQRAAERLEKEKPGWTGVVFPNAPLSVDSHTSRFSMTVRPHVLRDYLVDTCQSLVQNGFYYFVCFSGYLGPKQLTAIEDAGLLIEQKNTLKSWGSWFRFQGSLPKPSLMCASSALVTRQEVFASPVVSDPLEHGGKRDTSVALALKQERVNSHFRELPPVERPNSRWRRYFEKFRRKRDGYWGDPASAVAEFGVLNLQDALDIVFPKLFAVLDGAKSKRVFRSWYRAFPTNKSFFRAWVLGLFLMTLLSVVWLFQFYQVNLR